MHSELLLEMFSIGTHAYAPYIAKKDRLHIPGYRPGDMLRKPRGRLNTSRSTTERSRLWPWQLCFIVAVSVFPGSVSPRARRRTRTVTSVTHVYHLRPTVYLDISVLTDTSWIISDFSGEGRLTGHHVFSPERAPSSTPRCPHCDEASCSHVLQACFELCKRRCQHV